MRRHHEHFANGGGVVAHDRNQSLLTLKLTRPGEGGATSSHVAGGTFVTVDRVAVDQRILGGVPCIEGSRIPVVAILGLLGDDMPMTARPLPAATRDDVLASQGCAAEVLDQGSRAPE